MLSLLSIGVILLFFIGEGGTFDPLGITPQEWVGLLFFPIGLGLGMIVAWRWALVGGAITVGSLIAFYVVELLFGSGFPRGPYFLIFALPGFLFLAVGGCQMAGARKE